MTRGAGVGLSLAFVGDMNFGLRIITSTGGWLLYLRLPTFRLLKLVEVEVAGCTAVALPVEVVGRIAMTAKFESSILAGRAVCEGDMIICDVVEEMDFVLGEE